MRGRERPSSRSIALPNGPDKTLSHLSTITFKSLFDPILSGVSGRAS
jgi:hypothetical protein